MADELPPAVKNNLPAPTKNAGEIAKLTTGLAAAFASIWFPPAVVVGAVLPFVIDRYVDRPRNLLLKALQKGDIRDLSVEQLTPFVPMAYKVLEAAKEGEYLFQLLRLHCDKLVKTLFSHRPAEMPTATLRT